MHLRSRTSDKGCLSGVGGGALLARMCRRTRISSVLLHSHLISGARSRIEMNDAKGLPLQHHWRLGRAGVLSSTSHPLNLIQDLLV